VYEVAGASPAVVTDGVKVTFIVPSPLLAATLVTPGGAPGGGGGGVGECVGVGVGDAEVDGEAGGVGDTGGVGCCE
jgi:hypothetical protein